METIGLKAATRILDLSEGRIRILVREGKLPCTRDDMGRRRFRVHELKRFAKQRKRRKEASHA